LFNSYRHPTAALFHIIFKVIAVFIYLFGGFLGQGFLGIFVEIILLISIDFWVVKNITGRLLAGLRWWNYIDDEGNSHWVFENRHIKENQNDHLKFIDDQDGNAGVFWIALILTPIVWFLLLLVSLFRLNFHWFVST
jgi:protein FAM18B1